MSLGKLALGVASVVMGLQGLASGFGNIKEAAQPQRPPTPPPSPRNRRGLQGLGLVGPMPTGTAQSALVGEREVLAKHMRTAQVTSLQQRIRFIQGRVLKGETDPQIYTIARKIVSRRCGDDWCIMEKDNLGEAKAIFDFMRKNVRYTSDSLNIDTFQNPILTIKLGTGDCDDHAATTCALLLSIGIPCRLKVVQTTDSNQPNHIYAQAGFPRANPQKWLTMDSSVKVPFGWEVPGSAISKHWEYKPLP